jgi:hypothetical protein
MQSSNGTEAKPQTATGSHAPTHVADIDPAEVGDPALDERQELPAATVGKDQS